MANRGPCSRIGFTRNVKCRGIGKVNNSAALFAYLGNGELNAWISLALGRVCFPYTCAIPRMPLSMNMVDLE